ncbi:hypothetical protein ROZALSC1DRAFT_23360 [Rozella allomycis CSF55]|uniref:Uncharacterized protein n=1 Tax=Rozella allomycis (strain CSF55) TaxID=988480 RepID=A0A4P9YGA4_ROZAC|nr:hypothetical protein ROZALSC1DRAFT_23360 [Rozella allomycis CSF55]
MFSLSRKLQRVALKDYHRISYQTTPETKNLGSLMEILYSIYKSKRDILAPLLPYNTNDNPFYKMFSHFEERYRVERSDNEMNRMETDKEKSLETILDEGFEEFSSWVLSLGEMVPGVQSGIHAIVKKLLQTVENDPIYRIFSTTVSIGSTCNDGHNGYEFEEFRPTIVMDGELNCMNAQKAMNKMCSKMPREVTECNVNGCMAECRKTEQIVGWNEVLIIESRGEQNFPANIYLDGEKFKLTAKLFHGGACGLIEGPDTFVYDGSEGYVKESAGKIDGATTPAPLVFYVREKQNNKSKIKRGMDIFGPSLGDEMNNKERLKKKRTRKHINNHY